MRINEISPASFVRIVNRFNKINDGLPDWVKRLTLEDQRYREEFIKALEDERIWQKSIKVTDSRGKRRPVTISVAQRNGGVLELYFSIDHDFVKPKYRKTVQDTKLALASTKLVREEFVRILHTIRPRQLKFSAVLKDSEGRTHSQADSRANLYDRMISSATPYLNQIGYSVDKIQKPGTDTNFSDIEWRITRVDK